MPAESENGSPVSPRFELGPYRDADYRALPEEPRCELLLGRLLVTPSPSARHQRLLVRLVELLVTPSPSARHQRLLVRLVELLAPLARSVGGEVLVAPIDVALADHSVVQPDLVWVGAHRRGIVRERVEGAPDLVIEVLSPATARRDLGEKLALYARAGVLEYWLLDSEKRTCELLENRDGAFVVRLPADGIHRSPAIPGLELDLEAFWRAIPE